MEATTKTGLVILIIFLVLSIFRLTNHINQHYEYNNNVESYWHLSDKASTLEQKSIYINKFVIKLKEQKLDNMNSSLIYQTPNTDFNENFKALISLQNRLKEISTMDENNFAYQTALQQITEQEVAQATDMLEVFKGCWYKKNYYFYYNIWINIGFIIIELLLLIIGFNKLIDNY